VRECTCAAGTIARYQKRLSGPLLDRIDIHVEVRGNIIMPALHPVASVCFVPQTPRAPHAPQTQASWAFVAA